ncbi:DoxX family protein [Candidatus Woesearchaeota archaeon]|nr:DoxX family protein [Candidatus Woesearchaeota archaeon]
MMKTLGKKYGDVLYFVFRVMVGFMFFQHGAQKLFGWFGGTAADLMSLMGLAGVIEGVGGLLLAIGLLTRWTALVTALQMLVAYFMVHFPQGLIPPENKGELALLYFAAFLVLLVHGAGKWGLDKE